MLSSTSQRVSKKAGPSTSLRSAQDDDLLEDAEKQHGCDTIGRMYVRRIVLEIVRQNGSVSPAPLKGIDSFAMRNFTNDAVFDDTLPIADGLMEAGLRVPLTLFRDRMEDWLRRKGYLGRDETLRVSEVPGKASPSA